MFVHWKYKNFTTVYWDTSELDAGTYEIYVNISAAVTEDEVPELPGNLTDNSAFVEVRINQRPAVTEFYTDFGGSSIPKPVFRNQTALFNITGVDFETPSEYLTLEIQYRRGAGSWVQITDVENMEYRGSNQWHYPFNIPMDITTGTYSLWARLVDNNSGTSDWYVQANYLRILNNVPVIDNTTEVSVQEDSLLTVNFTDRGYDVEDNSTVLVWTIEWYNTSAIRSIDNDAVNNTFTFTPFTNFSGTTNITVTLEDKDGDRTTADVNLTWIEVNDAPLLLDFNISSMIYRTLEYSIYLNLTDDQNSTEEINASGDISILYRLEDGSWTSLDTLVDEQYYDPLTGLVMVNFTVPMSMLVGNYSFNVTVTDSNETNPLDSTFDPDNFTALLNITELVNHVPVIENITGLEPTLYRDGELFLLVNATDIETSEGDLTLELQYRREDPAGAWDDSLVTGSTFDDVNGYWNFTFSPDFTIASGNYSFRASAEDGDGTVGQWFYSYNMTVILNYVPVFDRFTAPPEITLNGTSIIEILASDIEHDASELSVEVMYRLNGTTMWHSDYVGDAGYNGVSGNWDVNFTVPTDAPTGDYDFTVRITDPENGTTGWMVQPDIGPSLYNRATVKNNPPVITDAWLSAQEVKRGETIFIYVNFTGDRPGDENFWSDPVENYTGLELRKVGDVLWEPADDNPFGDLTAYGYVAGMGLRIDFVPSLTAELTEIEMRVALVVNQSDMSTPFDVSNHSRHLLQ